MERQPVILLLLVDDEAAFREIFSTKLTAAGFKVATAADGSEGVAKAKELKPDLVLMDLHMPGMNGVEALMKLKEDATTKNAKVVFLTSYGEPRPQAQEVDTKFSAELGAVDYIRKTDDLEAIVLKVKSFFKK